MSPVLVGSWKGNGLALFADKLGIFLFSKSFMIVEEEELSTLGELNL